VDPLAGVMPEPQLVEAIQSGAQKLDRARKEAEAWNSGKYRNTDQRCPGAIARCDETKLFFMLLIDKVLWYRRPDSNRHAFKGIGF
jgi:hypothetical protein